MQNCYNEKVKIHGIINCACPLAGGEGNQSKKRRRSSALSGLKMKHYEALLLNRKSLIKIVSIK